MASARQPSRGRRRCARTEKSCGPDARGLCVKPCGDVAANRCAHRSSRKATGAIVHRSPRRARRTPFKPSHREGRDVPASPVIHPCAYPSHTGLRVPAGARPSLRLLDLQEGRPTAKLGPKMSRGCGGVSAIVVLMEKPRLLPDTHPSPVRTRRSASAMRRRAGTQIAAQHAAAWAPALQRTAPWTMLRIARAALRCVRGTEIATHPHVNFTSTAPSPSSSIRTLSPAFSHSVLTRLPVSTSCPACRPLPSAARWLASQASALWG
ncbi:hypothetical protein ABH973_007519 [Bradyrhizobium ottawaense]